MLFYFFMLLLFDLPPQKNTRIHFVHAGKQQGKKKESVRALSFLAFQGKKRDGRVLCTKPTHLRVFIHSCQAMQFMQRTSFSHLRTAHGTRAGLVGLTPLSMTNAYGVWMDIIGYDIHIHIHMYNTSI